MNFSAPFITRPIGTSLLALALILAGTVAYLFLPVSSLPNVNFPVIWVRAHRPGASPTTMAATVAAPLERRLGEISGISEMNSTSTLGTTSIVIQFDFSKNVDAAARDVQAAINAAIPDLPSDLSSAPIFRKANPAATPILILALTSKTLTPGALYDAADSIVAQRIAQISGVGKVTIGGGQQPAVRVSVDPARLGAMGLGLDDVRRAIVSANSLTPVGALDGPGHMAMLDTNGQLTTPSDYKPIIVASKNGMVTHLGDIAKVDVGVVNDRHAGWYNRDPAVLVIITKQADANVIKTVDAIKAALPTIRSWVPGGTNISILADRTITIRASFHDLEFTILLTVVLVMLVVFLFLRRLVPTFAAGLTVPLSLAGTLAAMWFCGFSLDNLSLMALAISVGFVVDDAIVMIENSYRNLEDGLSPLQAALKGAGQVGFTVVSISLSLVAAYTPMLFMGGFGGRLFREFSLTLTFAVVISAVVSLTVTPMVCGYLLKPEPPAAKTGFGARIMDRIVAFYASSLCWALDHRRIMGCVTLGAIGITFWLYGHVPKTFFPEDDTGMIMVISEASPNMSFKALVVHQKDVANIVLKDPAVAGLGSFVGSGGSGNQGWMYISLKPLGVRKVSASAVVDRLRPKLAKLVGISSFAIALQDLRTGGRVSKGRYDFVLWDSNINELQSWVPKVLAQVKRLPRLRDVATNREHGGLQTRLVVDRLTASRLGLSFDDIDTALNDAFSQRLISTIYLDRNQYHVILETLARDRTDPSALNKIYLTTSAGARIPFAAVAHVERGLAPLAVNHQGQFPAVTITYNLAQGVASGTAISAIDRAMANLHGPDGLHAEFTGNAAEAQRAGNNQLVLIGAALITIYLVLGILYESALHPLTILSTLPSAGLGALIALEVTGLDLSLIAVIGIILLIGIVKKNGIMLVDFALDAERHRGLSPREAIYEACLERFRPILMTSLAAALGAVPLAFGTGIGAALRQPLGVTIIGGMIVSQLLTSYTTPVIYLFFNRFRRRPKPTFSSRRSEQKALRGGGFQAKP